MIIVLSKSLKTSVSLFTVLILNFMYFVWQPYSKQIIPYQIDKINVSDIITNIIYFSICFFVMVFVANNFFVSNKSNKIHFKKSICLVGIMFAVQLISDIVKLVVFNFFPNYIFITSDILAVMCFLLNLVILINACNPIKPQNKKRIYFSLILAVLAVLVLIIYEVKNFGDISYVSYISNKYDISSSIYLTMFNNYKYSHEARTLFVETICSCIIFIGAVIVWSVEPEKDETDQQRDNRPSMQIVRLISRIILIGICFVVILATKTLILPKSAIGVIESSSATSTSYQNDGILDFGNANKITINRRINRSSEEPVYSIFNRNFNVDNKVVYNISEDNLVYTDVPKELYLTEEFNIDGYKCSVYGNKLFILHRENYYEFIRVEDISKKEYDQHLIKGLEHMILDGAYTYFEYGYEYLLKYDSEFISQYIEQYSNGLFYEYETENPYNFGIKEEYIQSMAKKVK